MADNSEKILNVKETRSQQESFVDISKLFPNAAACCAGILRATHCLRVAGRNPTISMAS